MEHMQKMVTSWRFQHFRRLLQNPTTKLLTIFFSPEITHWTYTCLNPLALNKSKRGKHAIFFFFILAQYPRNWCKHLCVCLQLLENFPKTYNFFYRRPLIGKLCLHMSVTNIFIYLFFFLFFYQFFVITKPTKIYLSINLMP